MRNGQIEDFVVNIRADLQKPRDKEEKDRGRHEGPLRAATGEQVEGKDETPDMSQGTDDTRGEP